MSLNRLARATWILLLCDLSVARFMGVLLCALVIGHETKKDIPLLLKCSIFKLPPQLIEKLRPFFGWMKALYESILAWKLEPYWGLDSRIAGMALPVM